MPRSLPRWCPPIVLSLLLGACGVIQPARMSLPPQLQAGTDRAELRGAGHGQRGQAEIEGRGLRFERQASRLALFDASYVADKSALNFSLGGAAAAAASSRLVRRELNLGVVQVQARPLSLQCELGGGMQLSLWQDPAAPRPPERRRLGQLKFAGRTLGVRSVHEVQGSPMRLAEPIGYLVEDGAGRAVAALEINGSTPVLYLPRGDAAQREASLRALLALALIWTPQ